MEALLASRGLLGSLRRTSVLVGALSTAIAMLAAVGIMVGSFRETVVRWMGDLFRRIFIFVPRRPRGRIGIRLCRPKFRDGLPKLPDVAAVDQIRTYAISYQALPATLAGSDLRVSERYATRSFLSGRAPTEVFEQLADRDAAIVSEPFANKHHVRAGDSIVLDLAGGKPSFRVVDVYYDYSSERGIVLVDRATLLKYLPDPPRPPSPFI